MPALVQPLDVRLEESAVDREQADAQPTGQARPPRTEEPAPERQRLLHWRWCDRLLREEPCDLADPRFGERVAVADVEPERGVLGHAVAGADAEVEAAVAHEVDDRRLLHDLHRMAQCGEQDRGADPHPRGPCRDRCGEGQRLREIAVLEEVVLREPDGACTEAVGLLAQLERPGVVLGPRPLPLGRVAQVEVDADAHGGPQTPRRARSRASRPRAITSRWISFVPSPMIISGASRK